MIPIREKLLAICATFHATRLQPEAAENSRESAQKLLKNGEKNYGKIVKFKKISVATFPTKHKPNTNQRGTEMSSS